MMCWNYDKTPWEEFPDMSISLLSSISNSKEFRLKIPPQVRCVTSGANGFIALEAANMIRGTVGAVIDESICLLVCPEFHSQIWSLFFIFRNFRDTFIILRFFQN